MKHDKIFASASFVKFLDIYVSYCYVLAHPSSHGFAFATVCTLCTRVHGHGIYIYIYHGIKFGSESIRICARSGVSFSSSIFSCHLLFLHRRF